MRITFGESHWQENNKLLAYKQDINFSYDDRMPETTT